MMDQPLDIDVAIAGAGMTGLACAVALAESGARILIVDPMPWPATILPPFDGRVTAVAQGSRRLLEAIKVWPLVAADAAPINDIIVGERHSPLTVHYDHLAVGSEPLGHIVENRLIRLALISRIEQLRQDGLAAAVPDRIVDLERDDHGVHLVLASGKIARCRLLIGAEGRRSPTREAAGIGIMHWDYNQTGIVATLEHEHDHQGLAIERFFPDGPLAVLPMTKNRSSIVWAAENRLAADLAGLDDAAFVAELGERVGERLGALALAGPRWHYPLALSQAHRYTDQRLALIGDAARAIHPIAGQGWNLALRDVAAVAELVIDGLRLGLDPGSAWILKRYARWRRFDSLALVAVTDGLNRLFANDVLPLRIVRELGLALVERTPPLKRFFMNHAMGMLGDLPRLMRGEGL